MFCAQCGNELPEGAKFCDKCGAIQGSAQEDVKEQSAVAATNDALSSNQTTKYDLIEPEEQVIKTLGKSVRTGSSSTGSFGI